MWKFISELLIHMLNVKTFIGASILVIVLGNYIVFRKSCCDRHKYKARTLVSSVAAICIGIFFFMK